MFPANGILLFQNGLKMANKQNHSQAEQCLIYIHQDIHKISEQLKMMQNNLEKVAAKLTEMQDDYKDGKNTNETHSKNTAENQNE